MGLECRMNLLFLRSLREKIIDAERAVKMLELDYEFYIESYKFTDKLWEENFEIMKQKKQIDIQLNKWTIKMLECQIEENKVEK